MNREKYLELNSKIEEYGLTPFTYLKRIDVNPSLFYQARKKYNNPAMIQIRKIEDEKSMKENSFATNDFLPTTNDFVTINGFKIEGNPNLIKEVIIDLLKETQNV